MTFRHAPDRMVLARPADEPPAPPRPTLTREELSRLFALELGYAPRVTKVAA